MPHISFKLPKYDLAITEFTRHVKKELSSLDQILGQIRTHSVAHDGKTRQVSKPEILNTQMKDYEVEVKITKKSFLKTDAEGFQSFLKSLSEAFNSQIKQHLFQSLFQITFSTGNTVDANGQEFWDALPEIVMKTGMVFNDEGEHNYQIFVHPDTGKKLEENPPTQEQIKKIENAINRKKEEYYAQKRSRRLS